MAIGVLFDFPGVTRDQYEIPLGARIIAVCDAFTGMIFPRPYAPQLTVTQAIAELRSCAGSQFDPGVVDAIANLVIGLPWPPAPATANTGHLDPFRTEPRSQLRGPRVKRKA